MNETLRPSQTLTVTPHVERGWYHLDRFDAHLDGDLVVTSRQPQLNRARALLDRGHHSETLLTIRHHGKEDSFVPRPIGELATCTYEQSDRDGIKRRRGVEVEVRPFPSRGWHSVTSDRGGIGTGDPSGTVTRPLDLSVKGLAQDCPRYSGGPFQEAERDATAHGLAINCQMVPVWDYAINGKQRAPADEAIRTDRARRRRSSRDRRAAESGGRRG
jgi:hypothetical protein